MPPIVGPQGRAGAPPAPPALGPSPDPAAPGREMQRSARARNAAHSCGEESAAAGLQTAPQQRGAKRQRGAKQEEAAEQQRGHGAPPAPRTRTAWLGCRTAPHGRAAKRHRDANQRRAAARPRHGRDAKQCRALQCARAAERSCWQHSTVPPRRDPGCGLIHKYIRRAKIAAPVPLWPRFPPLARPRPPSPYHCGRAPPARLTPHFHIQKRPPSEAPLRRSRAALSDAFHPTTPQHYFPPHVFFLSFKPPFLGAPSKPPQPRSAVPPGSCSPTRSHLGSAVPALLSPARRRNGCGGGANSAEYF